MIDETERRRLHAMGYLEARIQAHPDTSRFHHALASLYTDHHLDEDASRSFKHAINNDPSNVMIRNDYSLHLKQLHRTQDAVDELRKGTLFKYLSCTYI